MATKGELIIIRQAIMTAAFGLVFMLLAAQFTVAGDKPQFSIRNELQLGRFYTSPDSKYRVRSDDSVFQILDAMTAEHLGQPLFQGPFKRRFEKTSFTWSFSHNSRYLAVGKGFTTGDRDNKGAIFVFDATTGELLTKCEGDERTRFGSIRRLSFSQDDSVIGYEADEFFQSGK